MSNCLDKISFFMNKNIFIRNKINERIVHNIDPDILLQIILMNTNHTIFIEIAILICISERIPRMPSFYRSVIGVSIKIDTIDLSKRQKLSLIQSFGSALYSWISIVVATTNNDGNFFILRDDFYNFLYRIINV